MLQKIKNYSNGGKLESIRGEKEVQENLSFVYDFVEIEKRNREVLECQLVTAS